jgi:hypothetical protein
LEFCASPAASVQDSVGTFRASITWAGAQDGIGESVLMLDLSTVCRIPRKLSIAESLNSPKSFTPISDRDSEPRNCSNAVRNQVAICREISSICRIGICSRAVRRSVSTARSRAFRNFSGKTLNHSSADHRVSAGNQVASQVHSSQKRRLEAC